MNTAKPNTAGVLLLETAEGATVGVRFPDSDTARDWEDERSSDLTAVGWVQLVGRTEALRLSTER